MYFVIVTMLKITAAMVAVVILAYIGCMAVWTLNAKFVALVATL